ncbi:DUF305 domain-containing protein [Aeromicrobium sp. Leaf350]|uniref:DUF305 domain-containing protein n=1 Tax=Aeromicrobium sp. Leaf350 TaxID=2876565 RepID=UPI001E506694|nr:DUF305 domain-containing protein [Aeromicrobium sp. Leaf350]
MRGTKTLVLAAAAVLLAACGSSSHNDADTAFAQQMVPHHEQAVEMSDLALDPARGASPEVQALAEQIGSAQHDEIELMNGWLEEWGESEGSDHGGHGDGHGDHGGGDHHEMEGMLTDEQMAELADATGAEFDSLWLTGMIAHHEGAVTMAETAVADGKDPDVRELAEQIADVQKTEIAEMKALLG